MSTIKKKWTSQHVPSGVTKTADGSMDASVVNKLETLISEEKIDIDEVSNFFTKGFGSQSVQTWAYYSHINDRVKFTSCTITITKTIQILGDNSELIEYGLELIKNILTHYQKTLYRALSSFKASTTNPTLRLINEIVVFKKGALLDDFVALFDFTLPVLPKLLIPTKNELSEVKATQEKEHLSIRYSFVRLLLNLLKYSAPLLRKDFVTNNTKIVTNWFKYLPTIDSDALVENTLVVWDEKILKEQSFKKLTKLKFFNEWNIAKLVPLYYSAGNDVRESLNSFILSLATDSKYGIKFPQDESWFLGASNNSAINVNQKHFRTNNKIIYSLITDLKPWDDELQLNTVVTILRETQELIPPYMNYLASRGLHDPKLTSYWLGQTLLTSRILSLDIPDDLKAVSGTNAPSNSIIGELIVPSLLNRNVLTKCLQSDIYLIRQLSAQLIVESLQKLERFVNLYTQKDLIDAKLDLLSYIYHRVPELSLVSAVLAESYSKKSENKILQVTLLIIINYYTVFFNDNFNFASAISKPYMDLINSKSFSRIDLILLDKYFQLQDGESSQTKWWIKTSGSYSLFTSLLKIASLNENIETTITTLLSNLLNQTVVFNKQNLKDEPVSALVRSLSIIVKESDGEDSAGLKKIWNLLDESISRSVQTPFKYLDQSNSLERISPLIITIFEQWKFVDKTSDYSLISKWIVLFSRYLIILGEPFAVIQKLIRDIELEITFDIKLLSDSYENSVDTLRKDEIFKQKMDLSYFEFITTAHIKDISKSVRVPVSDLDIVGSLSRINSVLQDGNIGLEISEQFFSEVLSKIGNHWFTHPESIKRFSSQRYWGPLFLSSTSDKHIYVSNVLVEIFSQIEDFDKTDLSHLVKELLAKNLSDAENAVLSDSLWVLDDDTLTGVVNNDNEILKKGALGLFLEKGLTIGSNQVIDLLSSKSLFSVIYQLISKDLVTYDDVESFFQNIANNESFWTLFNALGCNKRLVPYLVTFATSQKNPLLKAHIIASLPIDLVSAQTLRDLSQDIKPTLFDIVEREDFEQISSTKLLKIFSIQYNDLTESERDFILNYALTKTSDKYTAETSNLVKLSGTTASEITRQWINKSVLYLTKVLAEQPTPTAGFFEFLDSFKELLLSIEVPKTINKANVNALLEVIFTKWPRDEKVLEFASAVIISGSKSFIEFSKLLQILVNNEENSLLKNQGASSKSKYYTALSISVLFEFDVSKNSSTALQDKLLVSYSGSTRPEDLILFSILEKLESKLNRSWIDEVYSWDFLDLLNDGEEDLIGETRLIEKKKEGFVIVLNKKFILNGLNNYSIHRHTLKKFDKKAGDNWKKSNEFYETVSSSTKTDESSTVYDPLFLSLLIINNDELVDFTTVEDSSDLVIKTNMKKLIESELFSSIVINLASNSSELRSVTLKILGAILNSLKQENNTFKDRQIFEILITKILYTFEKTDFDYSSLNPLVIIFITKLIPILNNPGNLLHEKAFRWVLNNPGIKFNDIPLYNDITTVASSEESDAYYKQLAWLIESFTIGVIDKRDIRLLKTANVFEWLLNLQNSPYINFKLTNLISEFVSSSQNVEDGAELLITRYGGITNIDQRISTIVNDDKKLNPVETLQKEQNIQNLEKINLKYSLVGQSKKRVVDWTSGDILKNSKRLHGE